VPSRWPSGTLEKSHYSLQDRHFRYFKRVSHQVSCKIQASGAILSGAVAHGPAVILLTMRYLIVRQNRLAGEPSDPALDRRRR
jgi:hypothetical protein